MRDVSHRTRAGVLAQMYCKPVYGVAAERVNSLRLSASAARRLGEQGATRRIGQKLEQQHSVTKAVKSVVLCDRLLVGLGDQLASGKRADQREQRRAR